MRLSKRWAGAHPASTITNSPRHGLAASPRLAARRLGPAGDGAGRAVRPLVVLAAALGAVDALLGQGVADGLQHAALAHLAADEVVDAVLGFVDGLEAGDFGLVEGVYGD